MVIVDQPGRTAIDFGVYGAPESFLVDGKGIIRYKHIGPLTPEVIEKELKPAIAALAKEPSS
jgi:cytochrome c biogenesis protein CcmG/thiol:disulfide interchange protein DsbE